MKNTSFFSKYFKDFDISELYAVIYEYIYIICDYSFNYCPTHYQMLYFYFPIFYLYVRSKKKAELFYTIEHSTLNYIFLTSAKTFKLILNSNFLAYIINNVFKKTYYFLKIIFLKTLGNKITILKKTFYKNHPWLSWKPVFKKLSYFGLFSFIRSKWYKNK